MVEHKISTLVVRFRLPSSARSTKQFTSSWCRMDNAKQLLKNNATMAKLADAGDSNSLGLYYPYRFESDLQLYFVCRGGETGRRKGLKIPRVVIPVPVRFRFAAPINMSMWRNWQTHQTQDLTVYSMQVQILSSTPIFGSIRNNAEKIIDCVHLGALSDGS